MPVKNPNENCLAGMACPHCGSFGPFEIVSLCRAVVEDMGIDSTREFEWDDESTCQCLGCKKFGKVKEFKGGDGDDSDSTDGGGLPAQGGGDGGVDEGTKDPVRRPNEGQPAGGTPGADRGGDGGVGGEGRTLLIKAPRERDTYCDSFQSGPSN